MADLSPDNHYRFLCLPGQLPVHAGCFGCFTASVSKPPPLQAIQFLITTYSVGRFTQPVQSDFGFLDRNRHPHLRMPQYDQYHNFQSAPWRGPTSIPSVLGPLPSSLLRTTMPSTPHAVDTTTAQSRNLHFWWLYFFNVMSDAFCTSTNALHV